MTPTQDDMNRAIAEDLAPCPPAFLGGAPYPKSTDIWGFRVVQEKVKPYCYEWACLPNFFTDPALTLMLMERLALGGSAYWFEHFENGYKFDAVNEFRSSRNETIGEAVAMAYARMRGLK